MVPPVVVCRANPAASRPRSRTKVRNLLARGVHPNWAKALGNSRKGAWRISKQSPLHQALPERYFTQTLGLSLLG
jgi:hypothetical protein